MKAQRLFWSLLLIAGLVMLNGCAKKDDNDNDKPATEQTENTPPTDNEDPDDTTTEDEEDEVNQGIYLALLTKLNGSVTDNPFGVVDIQIKDGEITVEMEVTGTTPKTFHMQHVHIGSSCPTMDDDANGDGFIDVLEGLPAYGPILIPLDGDLASQAAGASSYPTSDDNGKYSYQKTAKLSAMLKDLAKADPNPNDAIVKLGDQKLNLGKRHIIIHGVPEDTELPDTVGTIGDLPATATLPIACGPIEKFDIGN